MYLYIQIRFAILFVIATQPARQNKYQPNAESDEQKNFKITLHGGQDRRAVFQAAVNDAVEDVDGHGALSEIGIRFLFRGKDKHKHVYQQKRNPIADQPDKHAPLLRQAPDLCRSIFRKKSYGTDWVAFVGEQEYGKGANDSWPGIAFPGAEFCEAGAVKFHSGQGRTGRNTQSSEWRENFQSSVKPMRSPPRMARGIWKGILRTRGARSRQANSAMRYQRVNLKSRQVQTGTLVENQDVLKIVNDFVGKVGDHQTLYHFEKDGICFEK